MISAPPNLPRLLFALVVCAGILASAFAFAQHPAPPSAEFTNPQRVSIAGYDGDAMEPFLTRDGKYLFFNNLNAPPVNTNLYYATRVDDTHFTSQGEIRGVNSPSLEAVASMDRDNNFYFVSDRSYNQTASTLYRGKFANGEVTGIELVPGVSNFKPGIVNFDAEISADGNTLYYVESQFTFRKIPESAFISIAHRKDGAFLRDPASQTILKSVNNDSLNYAPAVSANEREMFFTRLDPQGPRIYTAKRASASQPFEAAKPVAVITGFVEAPALSPDEESLYYHKKEDGHYVIYRVTRP
ncbi:MAG TPA: hypothetical protein VGD60_05165 [Candidatus Acidoferrales bacterium]